MLNIVRTNQFKKDYQRCVKRGYEVDIVFIIIEMIIRRERLPELVS